jgi:phenylacetate-coenzyme A ligase PaaK-like adenylate-forming protein
MPLIRYQPGDIGVFHTKEKCNCGSSYPSFEIVGRTTDVIKFSDGKEKPARILLRQFDREPFVSKIRRFQARQDTLDEILILLEVRQHIEEKFIAALKERLLLFYGQELQITVTQISAIPQDGPKFKVFVPIKK